MTQEERVARLEAIYARIPKMKDCVGKCEDTCTVIPCSTFEKERIETAMGQPFVPLGLPPDRVRCSALTPEGRCSQYDKRPLICRTFGTMKHPFMRCEHGCVPERWISAEEFFEIAKELEELCGKLVTPKVPGWPRLTREEAEAAARLF